MTAKSKTMTTVLQEANDLINGARRYDYGPAEESFRHIANGWSLVLGMDISPEQVALCMVWLKMSRYLQGLAVGADTRDSIVDMAGYVGLIEVIGGINDD